MVADLGDMGPGEQRLFHGTQIHYIDGICEEGFDIRLSGKHGSVYGQGTEQPLLVPVVFIGN